MRVVIADTGPVYYLVLIRHADILPALFTRLIIPSAVRVELIHAETPPSVRDWMRRPPAWLEVWEAPASDLDDELTEKLDAGERAVINLATSLKSDLLLMDDRKGVKLARKRGFAVTGTLGVLELAAQSGDLDLGEALSRLSVTSFYCPHEIMEAMLRRTKDAAKS